MPLPPIGAHLLVFNSKYDYEADMDLILDTVRDAGFRSVEGRMNDPRTFKAKLDERGLALGGYHVGLDKLNDVQPLIDYLGVTDCRDVCNSGVGKWHDVTADDIRAAADVLNRAGRQLRDADIRLHYHNHAFEFEPVGNGRTMMDVLIEQLDLDVVDLCVDVAWVSRGGHDPASFLRQYAAHVGYIHLKDHEGETWKELGQGTLDFDAIMPVIAEMPNVRWAMVEQDRTDRDPVESCRISAAFLRDRGEL